MKQATLSPTRAGIATRVPPLNMPLPEEVNRALLNLIADKNAELLRRVH